MSRSGQFEVIHFTTVHPRHDTRIVLKELAALATTRTDRLALFVQDGLQNGLEFEGELHVIDTGAREASRIRRFLIGALRMWWAVSRARPRIAHFHDPELIPVGLMLKVQGVRVVYDVHEDLPQQVLSKYWIPAWLRRPLASFASLLEVIAGMSFDGIVAATPAIARRFPPGKTALVQNYPRVDELHIAKSRRSQRRPLGVYVGGLTAVRGACEMVEALNYVPPHYGFRLAIAGKFAPAGLRDELVKLPSWEYVEERGWLGRTEVAQLLGEAAMGIVLFHPEPNHIESQPTKLFEYMSAGLPVIASDFPLWREIVDGSGCGLLVDPMLPNSIASAMIWMLDHPEEAQEMGRRGREAVLQQYSWEAEAQNLRKLYVRLQA